MLDQRLARDAEAFEVLLQEPESGQESLFHTPLHSFLTQEELMHEVSQGGFRDRVELKRLAKKLLEERVDIRRIERPEDGEDRENERNESQLEEASEARA